MLIDYTNEELKYEDTKFFGKEASLMVLTEVEISMMRIRLVGRRIEVEVALKVPVYLNSRRRNQILSMRLPFFNISSKSVWLRLVVN